MKRSSLLVLCVLVLALVLTQCAPAATPTPVVKEVVKQQTVVVKETVIAPTAAPVCAKDRYALTAPLAHTAVTQWFEGGEDAAKENGFELVTMNPAQYSTTRHTEMTEAVLAMSCIKGIGVMSGESAPTEGVMQEAISRGVYVTQDGDCPERLTWLCMGTNNKNACERVAQEFVKRLNGKGNVVVASGTPSDVHQARIDNFVNYMTANAPGIKISGILRNCDDVQGTVTCAEEAIAKWPEMNGYYSTGALCAVGPASVFPAAGRKDILVSGVDTEPAVLEAIKSGANMFTYTQQLWGMGYLQVYVPFLQVQKKQPKLTALTLDTGISIVDGSNINNYADTVKADFMKLKTYCETELVK